MNSMVSIFPGLLFAVVLLITSEVGADVPSNEKKVTDVAKGGETNHVDEAKPRGNVAKQTNHFDDAKHPICEVCCEWGTGGELWPVLCIKCCGVGEAGEIKANQTNQVNAAKPSRGGGGRRGGSGFGGGRTTANAARVKETEAKP